MTRHMFNRRSLGAGLSTVVIAIVLATAGCTGRRLTEADRAAIRALDSLYVDAWLRDDTTAVLATLVPDAVLMPAGQRPLSGLDAIRNFWWPTDGSSTKVTAYTTTIDEIDGTRDLAYVRGTGQISFTYTKDTVSTDITSRSMTLSVVEPGPDGGWRIVRRMWGTLAP